MKKKIKTISELVDAFGGPTQMARWAGTGQPGISNWLARGYIPPAWHLRIMIEAGRRDFEISPAVFDLSEEDYSLVLASLPKEMADFRVA